MTVVRDTSTSWSIAGDATARALGVAIDGAITGAGLVQTSDTGQLDLVAGTAWPASEADWGYRVYRFDDDEQTGDPIFIKLTFSRGDSIDEFRIKTDIGKGTDGAGALREAIGQATSTTAGVADSARRVIHASFIDGGFIFWATADSDDTSNGHFLILVERGKDEEGEFDGTALGVAYCGNAVQGKIWDGEWRSFASGAPYQPVVVAWASLAALDGVEPVHLAWASGMKRPIRSFVFGSSNGFTPGDSGSLDVDGESRDYRVCEGGMNYAWIGGTPPRVPFSGGGSAFTATTMRVLMRNE